MKRLLCLLLSALLLFFLCACADKKDKESDKGSTEETKTTEEIQTEKGEEIATAEKNDEPVEIGTLPIIFGDDEKTNGNGDSNTSDSNSTSTPSTTTKKPTGNTTATVTTTTKKSDPGTTLGSGGVVETPIIPFN